MRVLELGDCVETAKAAQTVLQLGAQVIKIENVAQTQSLRSRLSNDGNPLLHLALDAGKQSVGLDFLHPLAADVLAAALAGCDGALIAYGEGKLLWEPLAAAAGSRVPPALVFDEPAACYDGYARTAHMVAYGDVERPPLAGPPALPALFAGVAGLIAFMPRCYRARAKPTHRRRGPWQRCFPRASQTSATVAST
jgi:CoA-transferase family III